MHSVELVGGNVTISIRVEHLERLCQFINLFAFFFNPPAHHFLELFEADHSVSIRVEVGYNLLQVAVCDCVPHLFKHQSELFPRNGSSCILIEHAKGFSELASLIVVVFHPVLRVTKSSVSISW